MLSQYNPERSHIYIYIHIHIHIYTHTYIYTHTHTHTKLVAINKSGESARTVSYAHLPTTHNLLKNHLPTKDDVNRQKDKDNDVRSCNPDFSASQYDIYVAHKCSTQIRLYLLTHSTRCRVVLEQLTGLQLVKKFPAFDGTRRLITALTSVRHLSLSWASPIQSIYPHPTPGDPS